MQVLRDKLFSVRPFSADVTALYAASEGSFTIVSFAACAYTRHAACRKDELCSVFTEVTHGNRATLIA